ncbi:hypothetical protein U9M48_003711 [Paspalum notatum var. saurae]|uniref:Integrase catalytic domain-containing protein n=1 Tax=Paspalum notatum var. saurae TaxID=547442 RepID=A0AAQ3PNH3_PASNO
MPFEPCVEFESLNLGFVHHTAVATFEAEPTLEQEIRNHQKTDEKIQEIREQIKLGKAPQFREDEQGTVWYKNRICVPDVDSIKKLILSEAHDTAYSIHPGSTKMYHDLKERFWWYGMKRAVARICRGCDTCRRVKAEHRDLRRIISDRGSRFTSRFGSELHDSLDSKLRFGTAYHPQTDGRTERTNQILEDMLRACAIQYGTVGIRVRLMPSSPITTATKPIRRSHRLRHRMAKVRDTAILEPNRERSEVFGPDLIKDAEQRDQDGTRKSYADVRRGDLTFKVDDFVYLKVSPMRGIRRFNMKGKPAPRYIGPFKIVERKGEVAYKLELPPNLSGIHNVFHVSQLKKCLRVPEEQAPPEGLDVRGGFDIYRTPGEDS